MLRTVVPVTLLIVLLAASHSIAAASRDLLQPSADKPGLVVDYDKPNRCTADDEDDIAYHAVAVVQSFGQAMVKANPHPDANTHKIRAVGNCDQKSKTILFESGGTGIPDIKRTLYFTDTAAGESFYHFSISDSIVPEVPNGPRDDFLEVTGYFPAFFESSSGGTKFTVEISYYNKDENNVIPADKLNCRTESVAAHTKYMIPRIGAEFASGELFSGDPDIDVLLVDDMCASNTVEFYNSDGDLVYSDTYDSASARWTVKTSDVPTLKVGAVSDTTIRSDGEWIYGTTASDGSPLLALTRTATEKYTSSGGIKVNPYIQFRCEGQYTEILFRPWGESLIPFADDDDSLDDGADDNADTHSADTPTGATIAYSLDGAPAVAKLWPGYGDAHDTVMVSAQSKPTIALTKAMLKAKQLAIAYAPVEGQPRTVHFDLSGLPARIGGLRKACHW